MITHFKSALNQITAEEDLVVKTAGYLNNALNNKAGLKVVSLKKSRARIVKRLSVAACIAVVACLISAGGYAYYKTPVAYLSIDINPSIELGINSFDRVVSAKGYNEDGNTVIGQQKLDNLGIKDALDKIIESASGKGFIAADGSTIISVTTITNNTTIADKLSNISEQSAIDSIKAKGISAVVYKDKAPLERREEANQLGISPGKLNLIQKIQAFDPTATVEQYKDSKVTDIMKKVVELKKNTIGQSVNNEDDSTITPTVSAVPQSNAGTGTGGTDTRSSATANNDNSSKSNKQNDLSDNQNSGKQEDEGTNDRNNENKNNKSNNQDKSNDKNVSSDSAQQNSRANSNGSISNNAQKSSNIDTEEIEKAVAQSNSNADSHKKIQNSGKEIKSSKSK